MRSDSSSWPSWSSSSSARPTLTFRELLKRHRLAAGLSQEELAGRAGLSLRGVSDLERGARTAPRPTTVRLLADALALTDPDRAAFFIAARNNAHHRANAIRVAFPPPKSPLESVLPYAPPPSGTVTFLFTDIEGSTNLLRRLGSRYADVLDAHHRLLRESILAHDGYEINTQGDGFFVAFPTAPEALVAATEATHALATYPWPEDALVRVRMGLHTGAPQLVDKHYVGIDVHRAARIAAAGHGGQVLLSEAMVGLVRHALPEGVTLRDLGAHRLKDLPQPERIFQAVVTGLPADFPPLKALDVRPHNLPKQPNLLIGREREVGEVRKLLGRNDVRLVTLTGPGGIGKTRLSLQVAAETLETLDLFPDGVWYVRLSRLTDPDLVVPTIGQELDLKESGTTPLSDIVRSNLQDKRLLLVLDNFEHVAAAAPQIANLLAASPQMKMLVTSRMALHLGGEHEYSLRPLAAPGPKRLLSMNHLSRYAAVALFIERAQAAQADFAVTNASAPAVAEICARLEGLPLAIELAAARIKLLPPPALLKRLERQLPILIGGARDLDVRQQTMRNTLAWSFDLLAPEEQRLFRRLAVFAGGCTLEAIEQVCVASTRIEPLRIDLLDGLSQLVDQNLIQQREEGGEPRFGMLHIVREFALEQLEASGEADALRWAHAMHVLTWAPESSIAPLANGDAMWLARMEIERDNVRAAVTWARGQGETELGLRLAVGFASFWFLRGRYSEGRRYLEELLSPSQSSASAKEPNQGDGDPASPIAILRVWALLWAARIAHNQYDELSSWQFASRGLDAARASRNIDVLTIAMCVVGTAELEQPHGDMRRGDTLLEKALAMGRRSTDRYVLCWAIGDNIRSRVGYARDLGRAQELCEEMLSLAQQWDYKILEIFVVVNLAEIAYAQGDMPLAEAHGIRALRLARKQDVMYLAQPSIEVLAHVADRVGDGERAARLFGAAVAAAKNMGLTAEYESDLLKHVQLATRAALGEEVGATAYAAARALTLEEAIAEALGEKVEPTSEADK